MKSVSSLVSLGLLFATSSWADNPVLPAGSASSGSAPAGGGSNAMLVQIVPFALMFAVIYFLMIRPQQTKMKEQQNMLSNLKVGDEVLTASGFLGKITEITDKVVSLEIAERVRVRVLKSQIAQVLKGGSLPAES